MPQLYIIHMVLMIIYKKYKGGINMSTIGICKKISDTLKEDGIKISPLEIKEAVKGELSLDKSCLKIVKAIESQIPDGISGNSMYNVIRNAATSSSNPFDYCRHTVIFNVEDECSTEAWVNPSYEDVKHIIDAQFSKFGINGIDIAPAISELVNSPTYPFTNGSSLRIAIDKAIKDGKVDFSIPVGSTIMDYRHNLYNLRYNWNTWVYDTGNPNPFSMTLDLKGIDDEDEFAANALKIANETYGSRLRSTKDFLELYDRYSPSLSIGQFFISGLNDIVSDARKIIENRVANVPIATEFSKKFCDYITTYCEVVPDTSMVYKRKMLDCEVRQILKRFK